MDIRQYDESTVRRLCKDRHYMEARDFLLGKKHAYERGVDSTLRSAYCHHLGRCYSLLGDYPAADTAFNQALDAHPRNFIVYFSQIESYIQRGRLKQAFRSLEDLISNDGTNSVRFYILAARLSKLDGDFGSAEYFLEKVSPDHHRKVERELAFVKKVLSANKKPNIMSGVIDYIKHLRSLKINAEGHTSPLLAITFLENFLKEIDSPYKKAVANALLSRCYLDKGDTAQSKHYAEQSLEIFPSNPYALAYKIAATLQDGDHSAARKEFLAAGSIILLKGDLCIVLANAFQRAGHTDLATRAAQHAAEATDENYYAREAGKQILGQINAQRTGQREIGHP